MVGAKTSRGRHSRDRIVTAAAELIRVRGVHGTSVDDVLDASGTGKGQFYHYFASKSGLVREVLAYNARRVLREQAVFLDELDSWEGIEAWFKALTDATEAHGCVGGCPIGSMAAEMADQDPQLRRDLAETLVFFQCKLTDALTRMRSRNELRADADPQALAQFVTAAQQGALLLSKTLKTAQPARNALAHALAHLRTFASETMQ